MSHMPSQGFPAGKMERTIWFRFRSASAYAFLGWMDSGAMLIRIMLELLLGRLWNRSFERVPYAKWWIQLLLTFWNQSDDSEFEDRVLWWIFLFSSGLGSVSLPSEGKAELEVSPIALPARFSCSSWLTTMVCSSCLSLPFRFSFNLVMNEPYKTSQNEESSKVMHWKRREHIP